VRPVSDLSKLHDALTSRLGRLRRVYNVGADPATGRPELISYSVIELDNLVLSAMRVLFISSVRNARTLSGVRVRSTFSLREEGEIAAFMLSVVNNQAFTRMGSPVRIDRKQEPTIRDPRAVERVFSAAGLTNTQSLQNALALNATLFANLATLRNFYAHRNADTWRKARRKAIDMGISAASSVDDIVKSLVPGRAVRIYEDWLDEAELFFEEACK
jgi:hypothetical protein